jgi:hypothetical protein
MVSCRTMAGSLFSNISSRSCSSPHVDPLVDGDLRRAAADILGKVLAYIRDGERIRALVAGAPAAFATCWRKPLPLNGLHER